MIVSIHDLLDIMEEKFNQNGEVVLKVSGNSMLPFFRDQETEVVLVKAKHPLRRADIIFYKHNGNWILHRLLRNKGKTLKVCGDALTKIEIVESSSVLAVVERYRNKNCEVDVKSFSYRFKVFIWMLLRPIRKILLRIYHFWNKRGKK